MPRTTQWTKVCRSGERIDRHVTEQFIKIVEGQNLAELQINALKTITEKSSASDRAEVLARLTDVIDKCDYDVIPINALPTVGSIVRYKRTATGNQSALYFVTKVIASHPSQPTLHSDEQFLAQCDYHLAPLHALTGSEIDEAFAQDERTIYCTELMVTKVEHLDKIEVVRLIVTPRKRKVFSIIDSSGKVYGTFSNVHCSNPNGGPLVKSGDNTFKIAPFREISSRPMYSHMSARGVEQADKNSRVELLRRRLALRAVRRKSAYAVTLAQAIQLLNQLYVKTKRKYKGAVDLNIKKILEYMQHAISNLPTIPREVFSGYPFVYVVPNCEHINMFRPLPGMHNRQPTFTNGETLIMVPYLYAPTNIKIDGNRYRIPHDLQTRLVHKTYMVFKVKIEADIASLELIMLVNPPTPENVTWTRFVHYHSRTHNYTTLTCWGSLSTRIEIPLANTDLDISNEAARSISGLLASAHRTLNGINADSPGDSVPERLPRLATITRRCRDNEELRLGSGIDFR